jgi:hypothetical protein
MLRRTFVKQVALLSGLVIAGRAWASNWVSSTSFSESLAKMDRLNTDDPVHLAAFPVMRWMLSSQGGHKAFHKEFTSQAVADQLAGQAFRDHLRGELAGRLRILTESSSATHQSLVYEPRTGSAVFADQSGIIHYGRVINAGRPAFQDFQGRPLQWDKSRSRAGLLAKVAAFYVPTLSADPQNPAQCAACGGGCNSSCDEVCFGCVKKADGTSQSKGCCNIGYSACPWCCYCSSNCGYNWCQPWIE